MQTQSKSVCWNAIVKNESRIIERCMTSLVHELDYWIVVDTGSTDSTQQIIQNFMAQHGIPGELIERPWVNFSHNRNEALQLAENKADYINARLEGDRRLRYWGATHEYCDSIEPFWLTAHAITASRCLI